MGATAILALVAQGIALLPNLISTGVDVYDRIQKIRQLADAGAKGEATPEMIQAVRDQLDADLADFNKDLPPEVA
jgi:hypothetical protein